MDREKNIPAEPDPVADQLKQQIEAMKKKVEEKAREERVKDICGRLNKVLAADPQTTTAVIETRYFCDPKVESDSPAVPYSEEDGKLMLGALGLLNAIVTPEYRIVATYDQLGVITEFGYKKVG